MNYDVITLACEQLSYRDKLRLAQLLIQAARKEEENANPQNRVETKAIAEKAKVKEEASKDIDTIEYVIKRLLKLKPETKESLTNSIKTMFQFQVGISDSDIDKIISELQKRKCIIIDQYSVSYPFHAHKAQLRSLEHIYPHQDTETFKKKQWQEWLKYCRDELDSLELDDPEEDAKRNSLLSEINKTVNDVNKESVEESVKKSM